MNGIVYWIINIVALILGGVFATFFIGLNWIKQEEKRRDHNKNGKSSE